MKGAVAVGIASVGRPAVLRETLRRIQRQDRRADVIVVCTPSPDDVAGIAEEFPDVVLLKGERGLPRQRNAIMKHLDGLETVVFFDDDFVPAPSYLASIEKSMKENPDVVMITGNVVADGILGPGLTFESADSILQRTPDADPASHEALEVYNGYGCNIAIRLSVARLNGIEFDENLPLYAWLEDVDFSRVLARHGRIVKYLPAFGVHLGVKSGRQAGDRLGYSQIANPIYLIRKGTFTWRRGLYLMSRNVAANSVRLLRPEPWIDRRGRLRGNLCAFRDLLTGRLAPERVLSL